MRVKPGVRIFGMRPEVFFALGIAEGLWQREGSEVTVTGGVEGKHMTASLHYLGLAADIRKRDVEATILAELLKDLREQLGDDFDVVEEGDHLHIEFQPKLPYSG